MLKFLNPKLPDWVGVVVGLLFILLFLGLKIGGRSYVNNSRSQQPLTAPVTADSLIIAQLPVDRGPAEAAKIEKGMTYAQVSEVLGVRLDSNVEKSFQNEALVEIRFLNTAETCIRVRLRSGKVVLAEFLSSDEYKRLPN